MNGLLAFIVVVALAVAVFFLGRSLFSHLRKVPASFDTAPPNTLPRDTLPTNETTRPNGGGRPGAGHDRTRRR